ncbi:MAG: imidazole glycerol phosphate synthase cyclase subunit [Sulfuricellaceae bacterium]|nr:imidazole glycerol phosphate synthase cyclase subunit [Sulfuricellaceae bacterium]
MLRVIPRLDIKGPNLIKPISFEGLRVLGAPEDFARKYYEGGADELLFMDTVASLYQRGQFIDIINRVASEVFIPIIVCGGVRSLDDMEVLLRNGADKIGINTAAIKDPSLITRGAEAYGKQCMVVSIEAKRVGASIWECYTDNGREKTGLDVAQWAMQAESRGAGEILVTSVDKDGTRSGFDVELVRSIREAVSVPVIASGGAGKVADIVQLLTDANPSAVCVGSMLHYGLATMQTLKASLAQEGVQVRIVPQEK